MLPRNRNFAIVPQAREKVSFDTQTGTKLILEKTREPWGEKDVNDLRNDLSLISEFNPEIEQVQESRKKIQDPGFQVIIQPPEFPEFEGPMAKQFLIFVGNTGG